MDRWKGPIVRFKLQLMQLRHSRFGSSGLAQACQQKQRGIEGHLVELVATICATKRVQART